jgi:hypothetical protein
MGLAFRRAESALDHTATIAPGAKLLDHPPGQADRGVGKSVGESLRASGLRRRIGAILSDPAVSAFDECPLVGVEWRTLVGGVPDPGPVDAGNGFWEHRAQPVADRGSKVPAAAAVALLSESLGHHSVPQPGY